MRFSPGQWLSRPVLAVAILLLGSAAGVDQPRVVGTYPEDGATAIHPAAKAIVISFDVPMQTDSYSVLPAAGGRMPELSGDRPIQPVIGAILEGVGKAWSVQAPSRLPPGQPLPGAVPPLLAAASREQPAAPPAAAQLPVGREMTGRRAVSNPIAGFSIIIPDDWEMATGALGNVEIAIDAPSGVGLLGQPALTFFHAPRPPQPQAEELVAALRLLGVEARARRTDRSDEWEVTGVYRHHLLGDLQTRWLCRQERERSYVVAVAVRAADEEAFREDIAVALRSCRLIPTPILRFFEEPTERAYRIVLPHGWQWREARILRTADIPGYFTWKAQSADGLVGCFTAPPGVFNVTQEYVPAETMARGLVLGELRKLIPDLRTEKVQVLHRANDYFLAGLRLLGGPMSRPRFDKVRADYVGTAGGKPVRLRVTVTTLMFGSSPLLEGRGNWLLFTHGVWAPVEGFDQLAPLAQGVQVSHWTSPEWVKKQREAVDKVLVERHSVMDRVVADWNAYVRDRDRVRDPDGGPIQEVPNRDGHVWKDPEGVMWLVPPVYEMETWVRNRGWKYIR